MYFELLAGAVGGGVEESAGQSSILHGRLQVLNHRVGVRATSSRISACYTSLGLLNITVPD